MTKPTGTPAKRVIFLNGEDTGLSAWSRNQAIDSLLNALRRRGHHTITRQVLGDSYSTGKGRVDFNVDRKAAT